MEKSKYLILKAECLSKYGKKVVRLYGEGYPCDNLEDFKAKLKSEMQAGL